MVDFPRITPTYEELPLDPDERREALLSILGQHICWTRDLTIARLRARVDAYSPEEVPEADNRLVYEEIAGLSREGRALAFKFAGVAVDVFIKFLLALLANTGTD